MICSKCKVKMKEEKRSFHKKRKWICPQCGRAKMQAIHPGSNKPRPKE